MRKGGKPPMFAGEVALVTGAASGIGKACRVAPRPRGASVVGLDIDPGIVAPRSVLTSLGLVCDVTSEQQIDEAL